jgi:LacI family transcriptional regulator
MGFHQARRGGEIMSDTGSGRSRSGAPTIVDVARESGVSMKTVSRVVNRDPTVKAANREKVEAAIRKTGYRQNAFARGLRARRSHVLGLLYADARGDYPVEVLRGALTECRTSGYHLMVEMLSGTAVLDQVRDFVAKVSFDGVVLTPPVCDDRDILDYLASEGIPIVRISPRPDIETGWKIGIDDRAAAREMTAYLLALGHTDIAHITGDAGQAASEARIAGFRDAMQAAGLEVDPARIVRGGFQFDDGYAAAHGLLKSDRRPSAIFAANDVAAAGVLAYANELGLNVPQDVSIAGFDGGAVSRVVWPTLTTIEQPASALGRRAVSRLVEAENGTAGPDNDALETLPHRLVVGRSTHAPADRQDEKGA